VKEKLTALSTLLELQADRSEGLANCYERVQDLMQRLAQWRHAEEADMVRWVELFHHTLQLNTTPLIGRRGGAQAGMRQRARLDLHLGYALGEGRLCALSGRNGPGSGARGNLGQSL
jgi:hypothetical protein